MRNIAKEFMTTRPTHPIYFLCLQASFVLDDASEKKNYTIIRKIFYLPVNI